MAHKKNKVKVGDKIGRLTVLEELPPVIYKYPKLIQKLRKFKCKCDCGNDINVMQQNLINGSTTSCGCFRKEAMSELHAKKT